MTSRLHLRQPVDAVVLDWYGTLAAPNPDDFWTRLPDIIEGAGGRADPDALAAWDPPPMEHTRHSASEAAYRAYEAGRLATLLERCGVPEPARSSLAGELAAFRYQRLFAVFPEVPAALRSVRRQVPRLALCSNWDWDIDRHLRHNQIDGLFDVIVCSASVGYRKPHPRIFETVVERVGVAPGRIAFVGDSWPDDVQGASRAGMRAVHLARAQEPGVTSVGGEDQRVDPQVGRGAVVRPLGRRGGANSAAS